jgi:hypothetical protein
MAAFMMAKPGLYGYTSRPQKQGGGGQLPHGRGSVFLRGFVGLYMQVVGFLSRARKQAVPAPFYG